MRRIATALVISTAIIVALAIRLVDAQPGIGFSKTAPLTGTGSNGSPLRITPCLSGSAYVSNGTSWECALLGSGDVTAVTTTAPLGVGGTPGATCSSGSCALTERAYAGGSTTGYVPTGGSSTTFLRGDGTWVTPTDTNTTYSAGANSLTLTSTTFTVADRDFGDITVGSTGTTMTIDNSTVTSAKLNITTTSCSGTDKISAIGAGGVGTCTADAGITGSLTNNTIPIATGAGTVGDSTITKSGSAYTLTGSLSVTAGLSTVNGTISAGGSSGWVIANLGMYANGGTSYLLSGSLNFALGTNGAATGRINAAGYNEGTTQTRSLGIYDGTGTATGDTIAFFDGTNREVTFYGPTVYAENSTLWGNGNDDNTSAYGRQYRLGTAPTLSGCTSVCTIESYSTDATGTITCTDGPNACTVTYTQACSTNASSCVVSGTDTAGTYLTSAPTTSAFTVSTTSAGAKTITYHCECML